MVSSIDTLYPPYRVLTREKSCSASYLLPMASQAIPRLSLCLPSGFRTLSMTYRFVHSASGRVPSVFGGISNRIGVLPGIVG